MSEQANQHEILALTANIVSSQVSNNPVSGDSLTNMIREVYETLSTVGGSEAKSERPAPAVPIKKSVTPDYVICLEDGKKLKMLKRHLNTAYNMTPEQYRERWGLPADYPMVAPNYAKQRSALARKFGLGTKGRRMSRSKGKS